MKKFLSLLLAALMILSLAACAAKNVPAEAPIATAEGSEAAVTNAETPADSSSLPFEGVTLSFWMPPYTG